MPLPGRFNDCVDIGVFKLPSQDGFGPILRGQQDGNISQPLGYGIEDDLFSGDSFGRTNDLADGISFIGAQIDKMAFVYIQQFF